MTQPYINSPAILIEILGRLDSIISNGQDELGTGYGEGRGRKLGEATRSQRALYTLFEQLQAVHKGIHDSTGLPYGALEGVDAEHQKVHIMTEIVRVALAGDVTLAFPEVIGNSFDFGRDWSVYLIEKRENRWVKMKHRVIKFIRGRALPFWVRPLLESSLIAGLVVSASLFACWMHESPATALLKPGPILTMTGLWFVFSVLWLLRPIQMHSLD